MREAGGEHVRLNLPAQGLKIPPQSLEYALGRTQRPATRQLGTVTVNGNSAAIVTPSQAWQVHACPGHVKSLTAGVADVGCGVICKRRSLVKQPHARHQHG